MGHFCRICGRVRPNEKFSGKGHRTHVCKECHRLPKAEREKIDLDAEQSGFLKQSRISKKNVKRLQELTSHSDPEVARRAELLIRVAKVAEGKRKRWRRVSQADRSLLIVCGEAGLIENWFPEEIYRANRVEEEEYEEWDHDDGAVTLEWKRARERRRMGAADSRSDPKNSSEEEEIPF